jgi:hypothetical protein
MHLVVLAQENLGQVVISRSLTMNVAYTCYMWLFYPNIYFCQNSVFSCEVLTLEASFPYYFLLDF